MRRPNQERPTAMTRSLTGLLASLPIGSSVSLAAHARVRGQEPNRFRPGGRISFNKSAGMNGLDSTGTFSGSSYFSASIEAG